MFLLIGGLLTVTGLVLPSGAVLLPGMLILLVALLGGAETPGCQAVGQLAQWHWRGWPQPRPLAPLFALCSAAGGRAER